PLKGDAPCLSRTQSGLGGRHSLRCARWFAVHEREGNMVRSTLGKRGTVMLVVAAAIAAIAAGPAAAAPAKAAPAPAPAPAVAPAPLLQVSVGIVASWAEGASWAEE